MLLMNPVSSPAAPASALSVALLQFNPVVGDLQGNARAIIDAVYEAAGAHRGEEPQADDMTAVVVKIAQ